MLGNKPRLYELRMSPPRHSSFAFTLTGIRYCDVRFLYFPVLCLIIFLMFSLTLNICAKSFILIIVYVQYNAQMATWAASVVRVLASQQQTQQGRTCWDVHVCGTALKTATFSGILSLSLL